MYKVNIEQEQLQWFVNNVLRTNIGTLQELGVA